MRDRSPTCLTVSALRSQDGTTFAVVTADALQTSYGRSHLLAFVGSAVVALARKPALIPTALRQALRLAPKRWWATWPYLPVPSAAYMQFRSETLSGNPDELPSADELVVWLEWCRSMRGLPAT